jgi:hypothetical protein
MLHDDLGKLMLAQDQVLVRILGRGGPVHAGNLLAIYLAEGDLCAGQPNGAAVGQDACAVEFLDGDWGVDGCAWGVFDGGEGLEDGCLDAGFGA